MRQNVLAVLDPETRSVLPYAEALMLRSGGRILLAAPREHPENEASIHGYLTGAATLITGFADAVETSLLESDPVSEILALAPDYHLILVHGRKSWVDRLLRECPVPVLAVPPALVPA